MTESLIRAIPTPAALAPPPRPPFDRERWEDDVLSSELPANARLVALTLARYADASGHLPAHGPQTAHRLGARTNLSAKQARVSLYQLEHAGFIRRPSLNTWQPQQLARPVNLVRPVASTVPASDDLTQN